MLKVSELLAIPSLAQSYVVAGHNGIFNTIKKLEVMEEPYPAVLEYLVPNGFLLTNFWSMKQEKQNRIQLVRAMIEARCAGLGIMPGQHLHNIIDEEIIELANSNDFPIIYIAEGVRWGDLISEYCELIGSNMMPVLDTKMDDVLDIFLQFKSCKDINLFCDRASRLLRLPLLMCANTVYNSNFGQINVALVVAKIQAISEQNRQAIISPISVPVDESTLAVVYFGERSIVATCIEPNLLNSNMLHLFHKIAPWMAKELDALCSTPYFVPLSPAISALGETSVYFLLVKYAQAQEIEKKLDSRYIIYERNRFFNYYIILIPDHFAKGSEVYAVYRGLYERLVPDLFILSQNSCSFRDFQKKIEPLKYMINKLSYLKGIFSEDEFPLLYILSYAPFEYKTSLLLRPPALSALRHDDHTFLDTLRLYIVLRNILDVANFQGIHVNSVKYRVGKALKMFGRPSDVLRETSYVTLLIQLELLNLEN